SAPAVVVPGPIAVEATGPGGAEVSFTASASDVVDGACATPSPCAPVCRRVTGVSRPVIVSSPAVFPLGDSTVTCTSTDTAGNIGTATFTVTVTDTTAPVLTLPATITVRADLTGTAVVTFAATAVDTVGGDIPVGCTPRSGSQFLIGTTPVTCTA